MKKREPAGTEEHFGVPGTSSHMEENLVLLCIRTTVNNTDSAILLHPSFFIPITLPSPCCCLAIILR